MAIGIGGMLLVVTRDANPVNAYGAGIVVLLLFGSFGALTFRSVWKGRHTVVSVDAAGVWLSDANGQNVIPWQALAGVSLWSSPMGRGGMIHSLELCPEGAIDRDDPVLRRLIRDEEPLRPGLPRLRYRVPLTFGTHHEVVAAVRRFAPRLWSGESERPPGHIGRPDTEGLRRRAGGRAR
ncbi:hypothetical protein [Streptomyces sp. WMMB303]|uniref:hypothetical protein n=1 Tax=Streptomyces sp. WMMB303 TaxID=3034154 RepID=UPI0023EB88C5|nr:hypothetical protein [Streptomyces sp. WMMB303]MDF4252539.1 hypothetical protein [Streptomyces sp. WMMB303]